MVQVVLETHYFLDMTQIGDPFRYTIWGAYWGPWMMVVVLVVVPNRAYSRTTTVQDPDMVGPDMHIFGGSRTCVIRDIRIWMPTNEGVLDGTILGHPGTP